MALSKKYLAPLALSFAVASSPAFADSEPANVIDSQPSFSCTAPTVSSLANPRDRFEEIEAPATVLIRTNNGSLGSGFIVDPSGIVVTNNHVVNGASALSVTLYDPDEIGRVGERYTASLVGIDATLDIAVLRIDTPDGPLPCVEFGDSDLVRTGDTVNPYGNPIGVFSTLSEGIVSHPNQELNNTYFSYIQTDAAINRGNSGGPLFNEDAQVIGVNNAIKTPDAEGSSAGIGFAIQGNDAKEVVDEILRYGSPQRAALGVALFGVTEVSASELGIEAGRGVILKRIEEGSVAERAGLQKNDIILEIDGEPVDRAREAIRAISRLEPDQTSTFSILRDGQIIELELDFSIVERSAQAEFADVAQPDADYPSANAQCRPGREEGLAQFLRQRHGEVHVESGSRSDGVLRLYADIEGDGIGNDDGSWSIVGHPYIDNNDHSKGHREDITCLLGSGFGYPDAILDLDWYKEQFGQAANPVVPEAQPQTEPEADPTSFKVEHYFEQPAMN